MDRVNIYKSDQIDWRPPLPSDFDGMTADAGARVLVQICPSWLDHRKIHTNV